MSNLAPDPFAGIDAGLRAAMRARGFEQLTPVQRAVLDAGPQARDLRISSQTGSGKTVALGLLLSRALQPPEPDADPRPGPRALVITPTRELAAQVRDELAWLLGERDVAVGVVTGGTPIHTERRMLQRHPQVLVATPGRLLDHLRSGAVSVGAVRQVALDEADRMLDMGFRDDLEAIVESLPSARTSHLVSATFPPEVMRLADRLQRDALHVEGTRLGEANADIDHIAHVVLGHERYRALRNTLLLALGRRCLVFVRRRQDASEVAAMLCADGFTASALSGELAQSQRTRALEGFRNGAVDVLVATDVAARGLDVADISLVVHGDLPEDADSYVHRSGRTGRAGQRGRSVLLVPPAARRRAEALLRQARVQVSWAPPPGIKQVLKAQRKRHRRALEAGLEAAAPSEGMRAQAVTLLEAHDPTELVAVLLELSQPQLPCEPVELSPPPPAPVRKGPYRGPTVPGRGRRPPRR